MKIDQNSVNYVPDTCSEDNVSENDEKEATDFTIVPETQDAFPQVEIPKKRYCVLPANFEFMKKIMDVLKFVVLNKAF